MAATNRPPMFKYKYMAHALGGYKGHKYLNNEEAFKYSLSKGHKFFEVDLTPTEDNVLLLSHGWTKERAEKVGMTYTPEFEHMTKEMFLRQKLYDMDTMDTSKLYQYMKKYPDIYLEIDLRSYSDEQAKEETKEMLEIFHNDESILDRLLVQTANPSRHQAIDSVYHFKYYQMFIKRGFDEETFRTLTSYCVENGIWSVALSVHDANAETVKRIREMGLWILCYTTDKYERAEELLKMGVSTICTNTLNPKLAFKKKIKAIPPVKYLILPPLKLARKLTKKIKKNIMT